jgi:hypothetical protein
MDPSVATAIAELDTMSVGQLCRRFVEITGEPTTSRHKRWLVRRIAWRIQANAEGGLSERALKRAEELARDAEIRLTMPRLGSSCDQQRMKIVGMPKKLDFHLAPGTVLQRDWKGQTVQVTVHPHGFSYSDQIYKSLSAVANAITGTKWNGYVFFGLKKRSGDAA